MGCPINRSVTFWKDLYVPPSVIKKFDLKTGDVVKGLARPPRKHGDKKEHYHAILHIDTVNDEEPR